MKRLSPSLLPRLGCLLCTALLVVALPESADARGGAGFARGGPASGGSLSSRPVIRNEGMGAQEARGAGSAQGVGSAGGVRSTSGARSAGGARSAEGVGETTSTAGQALRAAASQQPVATPREAPVSAAEMEAYRAQFRAQNQEGQGNDDGRWDDRWDDGVRHPVAAAAVVGAAANERLDNTVEVLDALDDEPAYQDELPCAMKGMLDVAGVTYYRCAQGWYKRGLQGDEIVYIRTDPPPGF